MNLILYILAHYVCDFALQSDWMAKNKNPYLIGANQRIWFHVMSAHCATHALAVYLISHSILLCLCEFIAHFLIDVTKMRGSLSFNQDQAAHIICKIAWVVLFNLGVF